MQRFVHKFLTWFPTALGGGALAIAAVWTEAKDWIAGVAVWGWAHMSDPFIAIFIVLSVAAYIAAILWTGQERQPQAQVDLGAEAARAAEIERARQSVISEAESSRRWRESVSQSLTGGGILAKRREERDRQGIITKAALDREAQLEAQKRRRTLIADCRDLAHQYTVDDEEQPFRAFLEGKRAFADVRGYLSADYLAKLNAPRTTYSSADGARYPAIVEWFLDELDRLEKEWKL